MFRPERRNSLTYRIYCDLVCRMRAGFNKITAIYQCAEHYGITRRIVHDVYRRFIRKSLASGYLVKDLR